MEALLNILNELHPDVDFETADRLIDDKILDSFDIVTIVAEIDAEYDGIYQFQLLRQALPLNEPGISYKQCC